MVNPFKYGREVSGRQFYDRQEAFNSLYSKLAGGSANVVMYAPRRYGKTSLVKKVLARFSEEGVPCVYFDLNRVESLERFCEAYASRSIRLSEVRRALRTLLRNICRICIRHSRLEESSRFPSSSTMARRWVLRLLLRFLAWLRKLPSSMFMDP